MLFLSFINKTSEINKVLDKHKNIDRAYPLAQGDKLRWMTERKNNHSHCEMYDSFSLSIYHTDHSVHFSLYYMCSYMSYIALVLLRFRSLIYILALVYNEGDHYLYIIWLVTEIFIIQKYKRHEGVLNCNFQYIYEVRI